MWKLPKWRESIYLFFKKNVNYSFLPGGWFTFSILISLIPKISMQKFANSANVATELPMGLSFKRVFSYILPTLALILKWVYLWTSFYQVVKINLFLRLIVVADKVGLNQLNWIHNKLYPYIIQHVLSSSIMSSDRYFVFTNNFGMIQIFHGSSWWCNEW